MTSKRVLLYGTNYYPEPIGIPRYTTEMAEDMAAAGHRVTVIAAAPLYPTWTRNPAYRYAWYSRETRNGVEIIRVPTYIPATRVFSSASFMNFSSGSLRSPFCCAKPCCGRTQ